MCKHRQYTNCHPVQKLLHKRLHPESPKESKLQDFVLPFLSIPDKQAECKEAEHLRYSRFGRYSHYPLSALNYSIFRLKNQILRREGFFHYMNGTPVLLFVATRTKSYHRFSNPNVNLSQRFTSGVNQKIPLRELFCAPGRIRTFVGRSRQIYSLL